MSHINISMKHISMKTGEAIGLGWRCSRALGLFAFTNFELLVVVLGEGVFLFLLHSLPLGTLTPKRRVLFFKVWALLYVFENMKSLTQKTRNNGWISFAHFEINKSINMSNH